MTIPCEDCLLVPSCKHKRYMTLFEECELLRKYIPIHDYIHRRDSCDMNDLQDVLKPSKWIFGRYSKYYANCRIVQEILDSNEEASRCNMIGPL